ncbi:ATP-binding protein [Kamptonema sp. UHCC 0994]|uniref:AAA family ATPase n=1 Tax=Kamptonema sp. UHCC 0994 TaxID=3031329 RepID=UPI0023BA385F|nr:ATP-binding protein [Kamptonema sp. UHCC 0994]MDF0554066.1 ATP-binding protein [Kamptonema sp. UHCC 0994]
MLIGFSVGNYKSFKDTVTFTMVASAIASEDKRLDENNVFRIDAQLSLLKSAAIYGANASGKSNLVAAINFMKSFVLNSSKEGQISEPIDVDRFRLSTQTEKEPSFFEIVFRLDGKIYRYGFEVDTEQVISEWLFYKQKTREVKLFERELDTFSKLTDTFKEGKGVTDKTRNNALFLSVVAQFNGKIAQKILVWFNGLNLISGLNDLGYRTYTIRSFENNQHKDDILGFVKKLDLGIEDIQIEKTPINEVLLPNILPEEFRNLIRSHEIDVKAIKTLHRKYNDEEQPISNEIFDLNDNESEGTKKLFSLAGPLLDTLKAGKILLIDELDARFHPLITCAIISLFNSKETNPNNAQLIFTTHDTNLLSNKLFRKDQIWFTEKYRQGATHLYSLVEYKISKDASLEKDYIRGKYGAIPFIGDLSRLIGEINE